MGGYSQLDVAGIIDGENEAEMEEKDAKVTIVLSQKEKDVGKGSRLWDKFWSAQLTFKLSGEVLPIQKRISQAKDEKLIDNILEDSNNQRNEKEGLISKIFQKLSNLE